MVNHYKNQGFPRDLKKIRVSLEFAASDFCCLRLNKILRDFVVSLWFFFKRRQQRIKTQRLQKNYSNETLSEKQEAAFK